LAREESANTHNLRDVAQALQRIGNIKLSASAAHARESLEHNTRAQALREQIAASPAANVQDQRSLADQLMLTGDNLLRLGPARVATENYNRALGLFRSLAMSDPANAEARRDLSFVHLKLGRAKTQTNEAGAREHLTHAMHTVQELYKRDSNKEDLSTLISIFELFAITSEKEGDLARAIESSRNIITLREQILSLAPDHVGNHSHLAIAYQELGTLYAKSAVAKIPANEAKARWREARSWYVRSLNIWQDMRAKGTMRDADKRQTQVIASEIAKCDAALMKHSD
jgi:hypothetical protein